MKPTNLTKSPYLSIKKVIKENSLIIIILITCSLALSFDYYKKVDSPKQIVRLELHNKIIAGTAPSPYQYRILVPFTTQILKSILAYITPDRAFIISYFLYDFFAITFSLIAVYLYLNIWFTVEQALIGSLLMSALMPINFYYHYYQPWSLIETGFFALGLYFIFHQKIGPLTILVALAALNRETAIFIPLLFFLPIVKNLIKKIYPFPSLLKQLARGGILITIWLMIFLGLRIYFGPTDHIVNITELLQRNLAVNNLLKSVFVVFIFGGLFWLLILRGYFMAPDFIQTTAWILPIYILTIMLWGVWYETRVLMPMYPIFLSLGLCAAFPGSIKILKE